MCKGKITQAERRKSQMSDTNLSIVLRAGYATFGNACLKALDNASFLKMEVGEKKISFTPAETGIKFNREVPEGKQLVLRAGMDVVRAFSNLSGISFDKKTGTKFYGKMIDGSLVFEIE